MKAREFYNLTFILKIEVTKEVDISLNTVQPIRDWDKIQQTLEFLEHTNERNYILFLLGISTRLSIQDILKLRVSDLKGEIHIVMRENKPKTEKRLH
jgi:integrase